MYDIREKPFKIAEGVDCYEIERLEFVSSDNRLLTSGLNGAKLTFYDLCEDNPPTIVKNTKEGVSLWDVSRSSNLFLCVTYNKKDDEVATIISLSDLEVASQFSVGDFSIKEVAFGSGGLSVIVFCYTSFTLFVYSLTGELIEQVKTDGVLNTFLPVPVSEELLILEDNHTLSLYQRDVYLLKYTERIARQRVVARRVYRERVQVIENEKLEKARDFEIKQDEVVDVAQGSGTEGVQVFTCCPNGKYLALVFGKLKRVPQETTADLGPRGSGTQQSDLIQGKHNPSVLVHRRLKDHGRHFRTLLLRVE